MSEIDTTSNPQKSEKNGHDVGENDGKSGGEGAPIHEFDNIDLDFGMEDADNAADPGLEDFLKNQGIGESQVEVHDTPKPMKRKSSKKKTTNTKKSKVPKDGKEKEKMEQILADAKVKARQELEAEKDRVYRTLPHSIQHMWGQIGFAKWGKTWLPVLNLDPYNVPPGKARDQWTTNFEKLMAERKLDKMHFLVYWYGENSPESFYSIIAHSNFMKYEDASDKLKNFAKAAFKKVKEGKKLNSKDETAIRGWKEVAEDQPKRPEDRRRGDIDFPERDDLLTLDDVQEIYEEQGIDDDGDSDADKDLAPKKSVVVKKRKSASKPNDESISQSENNTTKRKKKKSLPKKAEAESEPASDEDNTKGRGKTKRKRTVEQSAEEGQGDDQSIKKKTKSRKGSQDKGKSSSAKSKETTAPNSSKKRKNGDKDLGDLTTEEPNVEDSIYDIGEQELEDSDENDEDYQDEITTTKLKKNKKRNEKVNVVDPFEKFRQHFMKNEDEFRRLLSKWRDGINAKKTKSVLKCLNFLRENVKKMSLQYIVSYNLNSYLIQSKHILKLNNDDISLLKETRLTVKEHYSEVKKEDTNEFKPEIRFPDLAEAFERAPPLSIPPPKPKDEAIKVESELLFESQGTNVNIPPTPNQNGNDQVIKGSSETVKPKSDSATQTNPDVASTSDAAAPSRSKVKIEKEAPKIPRFSLGSLTRKKEASRNESSGTTNTIPSTDKQTPVDWFAGPPTLEVPSDPNRLLGLEFLRQMGSHFPADKVNEETVALSIEKALQDWASKSKPLANQRDLYWDRLHAIVAAICGDGSPGSLMHLIAGGQVKSAMVLVNLPESALWESFRGKHVIL